MNGAPLSREPENELGVVFVFATIAPKLGVRVEQIRAGFPDCIAYIRTRTGEKRIRIEFEYRSSAFKQHGHSSRACDWIVCWIHDWPSCPKSLRVVELRRYFGLGFNVWITCVGKDYKTEMRAARRTHWSVPSGAHKGDLVLYYFSAPESAIKFVYRLAEDARRVKAGWKPGTDDMATITRVCELKSPVRLTDMRRHPGLRGCGFVRCQRGRPNVTAYWPDLYALILDRNPSLRKTLARYAPEKVLSTVV